MKFCKGALRQSVLKVTRARHDRIVAFLFRLLLLLYFVLCYDFFIWIPEVVIGNRLGYPELLLLPSWF